jgi:hypothetical protein
MLTFGGGVTLLGRAVLVVVGVAGVGTVDGAGVAPTVTGSAAMTPAPAGGIVVTGVTVDAMAAVVDVVADVRRVRFAVRAEADDRVDEVKEGCFVSSFFGARMGTSWGG